MSGYCQACASIRNAVTNILGNAISKIASALYLKDTGKKLYGGEPVAKEIRLEYRIRAAEQVGGTIALLPLPAITARTFSGTPLPKPAPLEDIPKCAVYKDPDATPPVKKAAPVEPSVTPTASSSIPGWLYIHLDIDIYKARWEFKIGLSSTPPGRLRVARRTASQQRLVFMIQVSNMKAAEDEFMATCLLYNVPGEGHEELYQMRVENAIEVMQDIAKKFCLTPHQSEAFS